MITLTVYEDPNGQDRYQVVYRENGGAEPIDVTDLYLIASCEDQDGNQGFAVFQRQVPDGE
jgi:hypothetical protein